MTTARFEQVARKAVSDVAWDKYQMRVEPEALEMVWYCHLLSNKKAILMVPGFRGVYDRIFEVTYNMLSDELYVDAYVKESNTRVGGGG